MISDLQRRCGEAEQTLAEMSSVVEGAKLRAEDAEERVRNLSTARWISDSDVTACSLCSVRFSFSKRKVRNRFNLYKFLINLHFDSFILCLDSITVETAV